MKPTETKVNRNINMSTQAPIVIERNGIKKTLVEQKFGKKANNAGTAFWAPETNAVSFMTDIPWYGLDYITAVINKRTRLEFAGIFNDHYTNDDGKLLLGEDGQLIPGPREAYLADLADFTAGVAKLSDLEEDVEELVAKQQAAVLDEKFGETDETGTPTEYAMALQNSLKEVANMIKPLKAQIASIKAKYAERAAKREARAKKSAAATASTNAGVPAAVTA